MAPEYRPFRCAVRAGAILGRWYQEGPGFGRCMGGAGSVGFVLAAPRPLGPVAPARVSLANSQQQAEGRCLQVVCHCY
jgi:hypothetical protein